MKCPKCETDCPTVSLFCLNCGEKFASHTDPQEQDNIFKNAFSNRKISGDINLVLLGKTGVGKSTWINSFCNYVKHGSFDKALDGKLDSLIFSQFHHADRSQPSDLKQLVSIKVGEPENISKEYAGGNVTSSATAMPFTYQVCLDGVPYNINLIDTPGVQTTLFAECPEQADNKILEAILNHISQYEYINAFIILLKPDEERLCSALTYTLRQLFKQLHESAKENIVFAFTHSRYCDFDDTKTFHALDKYLKKDELDYEITDQNVFYFDSTPFRYLATREHNYKPKEDQLTVRDCWENSVESTVKLLAYVDGLKHHDTMHTISMYEARCIISFVLDPLVTICRVNEENISEFKRHLLNRAPGNLAITNIMQKKLEFNKLDKPMTVCTNAECFKKGEVVEDGKLILKNFYNPICCKDCRIPFVSNEEPGSFMLYFCKNLLFGKCRKCQHPRREHMHVTYELLEVENEIEVQTKDLEEMKRDLEVEVETIVETLSFLSQYVQENSMLDKNKDVVSFQIKQELQKARQVLARKMDLEGKLKEHQLKVTDETVLIGDIEKANQIFNGTAANMQPIIEIRELRKEIENSAVEGYGYTDGHAVYYPGKHVLREKEEELDELLKRENYLGQEEEYWDVLSSQKASVGKRVEEKKEDLKLVTKFKNSQIESSQKSDLIEGLEKIKKMYKKEKELLKPYYINPTPSEVKQRIENLCKLSRNGPTFKEIYDNLMDLRKERASVKPKVYKPHSAQEDRWEVIGQELENV